MNNKIYPCIWMNGNAKEAAQFYCSVFKDTSIIDENQFAVVIQSSGQNFLFLNGGPNYKTNPSISFFVHLTDAPEVDEVWQALSENGKILMPMDTYPWSEKYGWLEDRFGLSWQISLGNENDVPLKYSPYLTFTNSAFGKAEKAIRFYTSIFPDASITGILKHKENPEEALETVMHGQFMLCNQVFMASDSGQQHDFQFSPGVSLVISCENQKEIDHFWTMLTAGGAEEMCGWLRDRFGISWQVVPSKLGDWMRDPARSQRVSQAFMQMKKLDWDMLENA